jgi:FkbM family methyltransferase
MYERYKWTSASQRRNQILRQYEPIQPFVLMELAKQTRAEMFVDIGANIGAYTVFMSSLNDVKVIHSFEPSSDTFAELSRNLKLNNVGKAVLHRQGVSDSTKTVRFGIVSQYSGANSIVATSIHDAGRFTDEVSIDCVSLDEALRYEGISICLKIDVEGHEKNVLLGARKLLTNNGAVIQLEQYAPSDHQIADLLASYGYERLFTLGPDCYFSNLSTQLGASERIAILERAVGELIKSGFEEPMLADKPVTVKLASGIRVEISGSYAAVARRIKRVFRAKR